MVDYHEPPSEVLEDGVPYRYWAREILAEGDKVGLCFVTLHPRPGTPGEDFSVKRCREYARRWGYREHVVVNLFAMKAEKYDGIRKAGVRAIGRLNQEALEWAFAEADLVVAAWGARGSRLSRGAAVMGMIKNPHYLPPPVSPTQPSHITKTRLEAKPMAWGLRRAMRRTIGSLNSLEW